MTIPASAVVLGLAWFAGVNLIASVFALAAATWLPDAIAVDVRRARQLLALRFFPAAIAATVAVALFAPAHVLLEPADVEERYGVLPLGLAVIGLVLIARSVWRTARIAAASIRLAIYARRHAADRRTATLELPLLPAIALAGVFRPRVIIGSPARQALTMEELDVAVAHELAHRHAHDNLTRVLMACVPDLFSLTPAARRIERLWEAEAECLADARAAAGSAVRASRLASALVKVARLRSSDAAWSPGWSSFHHAALLETRVLLLVQRPRQQPSRADRSSAPAGTVVVALVVAAWTAGVPRALHAITERLLAVLP
jgi:hypothetical protein